MANMTFKASLLPNTDLGYSLGSSDKRWKIYGKLQNINLNSTTIDNAEGSFTFSGSGAPWDGTDWVGLQIGDSVDKFQIHAKNGTTLEYRQNDNGGTNTSWQNWVSLLSSGNYTDYTVTKTGSGATGTWGINITGNADKDGSGNVITSTYVKKSGDTLTGKLTFNKVNNAIAYTGTQATYDMIKFKDNTDDNYGNGIIIGGGGLVVIGSGESADAVAATHSSGGNEVLDLSSDNEVNIWTNVQNGISSAKKFTFGTNGILSATGFSGPLTGNATTATNATNDSDGNQINTTYLKRAGGSMTGTIDRTYSASNQTPFIHIDSGDYDNYIWQIGSGTSTNQYFGYGLKYIGTGSGVNNLLRLYADNQNSTDKIAIGINQNGQVGIGTDASTSYRLYVDGTGKFNDTLHLAGDKYKTNSSTGLDCHNSDISNINGIYMADNADAFSEGLNFYRSSTTWDSVAASNGTFYFGSNHAYNDSLTGDAAIQTGTIKVNSSYPNIRGNGTGIYFSIDDTWAANKGNVCIEANALRPSADSSSNGMTLGTSAQPWGTVYGTNFSGNAETATKLSNTPNNTTTFLRGDNTWSNTLTGTIGATNLQLSGSGEINYQGTKANYTLIKMLDNTNDNYGNGIRIGGGGLVMIGAGESASNLYSALSSPSGGSETMYLTSDGGIYFYSTCDSIANRRGFRLDNGNIIPTAAEANKDNTYNLGASGARWANAYITTTHGALDGNATSASQITQTAITASSYTNWRPIIWGASNSGTEGFTPSTITDTIYTAQTLSCQPSTGTIRAKVLRLEQDNSADPSTSSAARIDFSYNGGTGSQHVHIAYTPNDAYRAPAGLKIMGSSSEGSSPAWLEIEGQVIAGASIIAQNTTNDTAGIAIELKTKSYDFGLHMGTGGENHGIYDFKASKWVMLGNASHNWVFNGNVNGNVNGNANTATKLSNTPNNTTTFLRGDNTWSNTISNTLNIYRETTDTNILTDSGAAKLNFNVKATEQSNTQGYSYIASYQTPTATTYNDSLVIVASGACLIGGGEGAETIHRAVLTSGSGTENLYLCPDGDIHYYMGADSKTLRAIFNSSSQFYPATNNSGAIGTSSNKWANMYATTFHGSLDGNAATATALTSNAGSSTVPIYFSGGKPVQCSTTLGVSITGNAATATHSTYVDYKSAWVDLSSLNANTYYPVTGDSLPYDGYHLIKVSVQLNSGTKPSWSTHDAGFTVNVLLYTTASGWGTTGMETLVLDYYYGFANGMPVSYTQQSYSSTPVLWMRGGGKYRVWTDYNCNWTVRTSTYYTYGKSGDTYTQTVAPQSTLPAIQCSNSIVKAGQVWGAVWNDYAEMRNVPKAQLEEKSLRPGSCVREVGDGTMVLTTERLQRGCKIISDTFGFNIGETNDCKTPIAVSGRALVYLDVDREIAWDYIGWPVCSGPNGTVSIMTEEEEEKYPSRIVGTISEIPSYETWGSGNVPVNGRIWIYVR